MAERFGKRGDVDRFSETADNVASIVPKPVRKAGRRPLQ
jgi:hypothetical protein